VALVLSMLGLAFAMRDLPVGTAYAVWVGIGAGLTVVHGMLTGTGPSRWCGCCSSPGSSAASWA
jgi:quaternary ammonium compound-resistance protein SugE